MKQSNIHDVLHMIKHTLQMLFVLLHILETSPNKTAQRDLERAQKLRRVRTVSVCLEDPQGTPGPLWRRRQQQTTLLT